MAVGFGLAASPERKLSTARSWTGKQTRYATPTPHPENRGLADELVLLLAGGMPGLVNELRECLRAYEGLISHLRAKPLFTRQDHSYGLDRFLALWVSPQIAVLLRHTKDLGGMSSPLGHIFDLLPLHEETDYDIVKRVKQAVRRQLPAENEAGTAEFRHALNRLDARSDKKLVTIDREIEKLGEALHGRIDAETLQNLLASICASYYAGIALKRFIDALSALEHPNPVQFLRSIRSHYEILHKPTQQRRDSDLVWLQSSLFYEMRSDFFRAMDPRSRNSTLQVLVRLHWRVLKSIEPRDCAPLVGLMRLSGETSSEADAFESAKAAFEQHENYTALRPFAENAVAHFALAHGDLALALAGFLRVVECARWQQLGTLGTEAARIAIALEVLFSERWNARRLDPLITYLAQAQQQRGTLSVGYPSPFCMFSDSPSLTAADEMVMDAIKVFNSTGYKTVEGALFCHPLKRLDDLLAGFFTHLRQELEAGAGGDDAISRAVDRAFTATARTQSVMRFLTVTPYEALRDLYFYVDRIYGVELFFTQSPNCLQYVRLQDEEQLAVLRSLDPVCYKEDMARYARPSTKSNQAA
ncbi:hypothetical protein OKW49_008031 [Paraburkholderia youngii]|uniref:hypothetical protein n=1 Tax=Paraburkholderia youngii TaxID=2782701 RepID=UPI003D22729B